MFDNLMHQTEKLAEKNTELVATGVFSLGGIIAVMLFAWVLRLINGNKPAHKQEKEES